MSSDNSKWRQISHWFRSLLRRDNLENELDSELRFDLERRADANVRGGMTPEEARRAALRAFGAIELAKDECRDTRGTMFLEQLWQDIRFSLRMMRKSPGFTFVAVLTLALGIGANTAMFSFLDAVLLKPLPVAKPSELVMLAWDSPARTRNTKSVMTDLNRGYDGSESTDPVTGRRQGTSFGYMTFQALRDHSETLNATMAFAPIEQLNVIVDGQAEVASGQFVSGTYYTGLGVPALRGRVLATGDDSPAAPPAAVITWNYWQRRFSGDPRAIGMKVELNNAPFTIVGVTPPAFLGALDIGESADISIPIETEPLVDPVNPDTSKPALWWLCIMGRLKPGVSRERAQANMEGLFQQAAIEGLNAAVAAGTAKPFKVELRDYPRLLVRPGSQGETDTRASSELPLIVLMIVIALVLLIACVNIANLLLARGAARQQEIAMRLTLGASRARLVRQLLTESILLSLVAGLFGVLIAVWGRDVIIAWSPWGHVGMNIKAGLDLRVLAFTFTISFLTGTLFGLVPALRASRTELTPSLKLSTGSGGRSRSFVARALVAAQVGMSLVLLFAAGLFARTLHNLRSLDVGFNRQNVLIFRLNPQTNGYKGGQLDGLYHSVLAHLRATPGVTAVAMSRHPLLSSSLRTDTIYIPEKTGGRAVNIATNLVSSGFFDTMQMSLLSGRAVDEHDTVTSPLVALVNDTFARRYFPGTNPVGQRFWMGVSADGPGIEIIGVTHDAKYTNLRAPIPPTIYQPYGQAMPSQASFEVRYSGSEQAVVDGVRRAIHDVDARLPLFDLKTQAEQSENSIAQERMFAGLSQCVSALALLLAAIGLFGTMSYSVRRRTREIGIRMALGAQRKTILEMVLRQTLALVAAGLAIGLPVALAVSRVSQTVLQSLLYGVKPWDPFSLTAAACVLAIVALLAGFLPARRATRVDPMTALRNE
jgi:predicted permease